MSLHIYRFPNDEPDLNLAIEQARASFKYFWRELSWERRRIVPGLDMSAVKFPFATGKLTDAAPSFEYMWLGDVDFDGLKVSGELLNDPQWADGIGAGDRIERDFNEIYDWIYSINRRVYGGYTVQAMRLKMDGDRRRKHDEAWGLEFGDPREVKIFPDGYLKTESGDREEYEIGEHPMSENMAEQIDAALSENPDLVNQIDRNGWTMLHYEALAGNLTPIRLLLKHGADRTIQNSDGLTAIELAKFLNWNKIVDFLK